MKTANNKIADKKTDLMSNIKYTDVKLKNGDIVVFVENNNNTEVSFSLEIEYYKRDTRLIGKTVEIFELKRQLLETEKLYDFRKD